MMDLGKQPALRISVSRPAWQASHAPLLSHLNLMLALLQGAAGQAAAHGVLLERAQSTGTGATENIALLKPLE